MITPATYLIIDNTTNQAYVGSSQNVRRRIYKHNDCLKNNNHPNENLQQAFNAGHKLEVIVTETESKDTALDLEQSILDECFDSGMLLNIAKDARYSNKGIIPSQETRDKISKSNKGRIFTDEHKQKLHDAHIGKNINVKQREALILGASQRKKSVVINSQQFPSVKNAAEVLNLNEETVRRRLKDSTKYTTWNYFNQDK